MTIRSKIYGAAALASLAAFQSWAYADGPPQVMDFITHNQVLVKADPSHIWPHIVKLSDWKKGAELVPLDANSAGVGGRFKAIEGNPPTVSFYAETVEFVPSKRRTNRLNATDGTLIGYATWRLVPQGKFTLVQYDVYCRVVVPVEGENPSVADIGAAKKHYYDTNFSRFDAELAGLKELVESPPRQSAP